MARHLMSLICKKIIIDDTTKLPSYIDTLVGADYGVSKIPETLPGFSIASMWISEAKRAEKVEIRVTLKRPSGKEDIMGIAEIRLGGKEGQRANLNIEVGKLLADSEGLYFIDISAKSGKKLLPGAQIPFTVSQQDKTVQPSNALKNAK